MLKNKLQMFMADSGADGGASGAENATVETTETQTTETATEQPKTYTQEELEKILQAESDRKVSKALETTKAKWEQEYKAKLEAEKQEAAKLAKLSEAEKQKALLDKQQNELSEKEKQIALREMKLESVKILSEKGLPVSFVDLLTTGDADSTKANIDTFDTAFKTALEVAVNERLKSSSVKPQVGATATDLNAKLEEARKKAMATGKHEDRVAYAQIKHELEQQNKK
jgi:hypothetical protein